MNRSISNKSLYNRVKNDAKKKFKAFPSAYASAWIVKEYKKRGGKYKGSKPMKSGINRWMKEKWINVCELPKIVPCGRKKASRRSKYPYCRPLRRITSGTPKTISQISKRELKKRCSMKRKRPSKRLIRNDGMKCDEFTNIINEIKTIVNSSSTKVQKRSEINLILLELINKLHEDYKEELKDIDSSEFVSINDKVKLYNLIIPKLTDVKVEVKITYLIGKLLESFTSIL